MIVNDQNIKNGHNTELLKKYQMKIICELFKEISIKLPSLLTEYQAENSPRDMMLRSLTEIIKPS